MATIDLRDAEEIKEEMEQCAPVEEVVEEPAAEETEEKED